MGRRALRKPDPDLDLSGHLHELESLPRPLDPCALFGREAPLEIEVGSGKGLFLQTATEALPSHDFLGVELARKYASCCAARLARRQQTNGKVISGDALRLFHEWLPDACAAAVHVYFPDPWWKKRHHKRRVMNESFVARIEQVLVIGGALHFWTDVEPYFTATLELVAEKTGLRGPEPVAERPAEHELDYRTHFERRMRLHAAPVHRAIFRRVAGAARRSSDRAAGPAGPASAVTDRFTATAPRIAATDGN